MDIPVELMYIIGYNLEDIDIENYIKAFPNLDKDDFWNNYVFNRCGYINVTRYIMPPTKSRFYSDLLNKIATVKTNTLTDSDFIDEINLDHLLYDCRLKLYWCRSRTISRIPKLCHTYNFLLEQCNKLAPVDLRSSFPQDIIFKMDSKIIEFYIGITELYLTDSLNNFRIYNECYSYMCKVEFPENELKEIIKQIYYNDLFI